jgi:Family of unknown function (DUF6270)/Heparinase II/III-like protein/Heparinase II/III N-terminus
MRNILIFGSCVSRDTFNFDDAAKFNIINYYARSSFASAFSNQKAVDRYTNKITSAFQRKIVAADLSKELLSQLTSTSFDLLLIDLIDERFSLFEFENGALVTQSNELISGSFDKSSESGRSVASGSEEFFRLWETGWNSFIQLIKDSDQIHKIRINKAFWANETADGQSFSPNFPEEKIKSANNFLSKLYERISQDIAENQFLISDRSLLVGSTHHRWGLSPFHFIDEYYLHILDLLDKDAPEQLEQAPAPKPHQLTDRHVSEWAGLSRGSDHIDRFDRFEQSKLSGNCTINKGSHHLEAIFNGNTGAHQLRFHPSKNFAINGVGGRIRLRDWKNVRYIAIGYVNGNNYVHVKIANVLRDEWFDITFSVNDLAYGIQNGWDVPKPELIDHIRLYINGNPASTGGLLDIERIWYFREDNSTSPAFDREPGKYYSPVRRELLQVIHEYLDKCYPTAYKQAEAFMTDGSCPLIGDITLDWPVDVSVPVSSESIGTYRYSWHALHNATILLMYANKTSNLAAIFAARELTTNWLERSYFQPEVDKKFAWYDHGTAERTLALILMWAKGVELNFDRRFMARLQLAIYRHAQLLESEVFYASHQATRYHNHAWFQDLALIATAIAMPGFNCSTRWLEKGLDRITDQLDTLIVRDNGYAIFVENSIGYHQGIQRLVELAGELIALTDIESDIPAIGPELSKFSKFFTYPDNRSPAQGDTFRRGNPSGSDVRHSRPYPASNLTLLPDAGYAIVKGNHEGRPFMLTMLATSLCKTHKHEDNLSLTLFFDGLEWLTDPSFYSHEYAGPLQSYLRSAAGHNTIFISDTPYSIEPKQATIQGSSTSDQYQVTGHHIAYEGIKVSRSIAGDLNQLHVEINDLAETPDPKSKITPVIMLQCGEGVIASASEKQIILSHPDSEFRLVISMPAANITRYRNHKSEEKIRGIAGLGFMQESAIDTVECAIAFNKPVVWRIRAERQPEQTSQ